MRELKGDWRDLFNGFMIALDLRKMFLAFCAIVLTFVVIGMPTYYIALNQDAAPIPKVEALTLHELGGALCASLHVIYSGTDFGGGSPWVYIPYSVGLLMALFAIWGYFGGAISRIAAYEVAKDGERIETTRALKFAQKKFTSFMTAPLICVGGFFLFYLCNWIVGFLGGPLDAIGGIGGVLLAIFLPLALLAGFIMMLIVVGSLAGAPLFTPAVAAEGTDSFDAVSRGFSYIYSRPWQYVGYQGISVAYGIICVAFVFLFAVGMADIGLRAGAKGFDSTKWGGDVLKGGKREGEVYHGFDDVRKSAWSCLMSAKHEQFRDDKGNPYPRYQWEAFDIAEGFHPYGRTMNLANQITNVNFNESERIRLAATGHYQLLTNIVFVWLLIVVGFAYGYGVSFFYSQQTLIYFILRRKVDGIEMNEVFEEAEEEEILAEPAPAEEAPKKSPGTTRRRKPGTQRSGRRTTRRGKK